MLSKEKYDQLKFQIAAHKPLSSIVAMSVEQVESLFEMIDKLQDDYTAQSLALKAAKAMQQSVARDVLTGTSLTPDVVNELVGNDGGRVAACEPMEPAATVNDRYSRDGFNDEISSFLPVGTQLYTEWQLEELRADMLATAQKAARVMQQAETERADAAEEEAGRISDKLQSMRQDRDHWKANHENQVRRARILMERPDMPIERVKAYQYMIGLENDAKRYRYIRTKERMILDTESGEVRMASTLDCAEQFDEAVDAAMEAEQ